MKEYAKHDPKSVYSNRINNFSKLLELVSRKANILSNLRIIVFLLGIGFSVYLFLIRYYAYSGIAFIVTIVLFLFLLIQHEKKKRECEVFTRLIAINESSIQRITGEWVEFVDQGTEFIDPEHQYSIDLDVFGKASLFQWLNVTSTYRGRRSFAEILTNPLTRKAEILQRQDAIQELAGKVDWRQRLQAEGLGFKGISRNPERLIQWAESSNKLIHRPIIVFFLRFIPILTVLGVILALAVPGIPGFVGIIPILFQLLLLRFGFKYIREVYDSTMKYKKDTKIYQGLFKCLEEEHFESTYLTDLQVRLFDEQGRLASHQISSLSKIVDNMEIQYVPIFHFLMNMLVMWDYQCVLALENWKEKSGQHFGDWLDVIGQAEVLSSFAIIPFDHQSWAFPEIYEEKAQVFSAKAMGHPLLQDHSRVCNDLSMAGQSQILVITGSNMSGKSTLLRTVGINLLLSYTGAPVCANQLKCSIMGVYSSMRVNDNLEKNISSFYAELIRVKMIIEAAQQSDSMLFLLDEIFRGTNSKDRHLGAITILHKLSQWGAMGLVSTHDLELGELEKETDLKIKNYHFTETYSNNQIHFDYKLKPGVSNTTNAIYLMKMVGIDIENK